MLNPTTMNFLIIVEARLFTLHGEWTTFLLPKQYWQYSTRTMHKWFNQQMLMTEYSLEDSIPCYNKDTLQTARWNCDEWTVKHAATESKPQVQLTYCHFMQYMQNNNLKSMM